MPEEQNRIAEELAAPGSAVRQFHIGNTPQLVPPDLNQAEEQSLEAQGKLLKTPTARPPFGVDDDGNPRPDPSLVGDSAPEPKAKEPDKPADKAADKPADKPPAGAGR